MVARCGPGPGPTIWAEAEWVVHGEQALGGSAWRVGVEDSGGGRQAGEANDLEMLVNG